MTQADLFTYLRFRRLVSATQLDGTSFRVSDVGVSIAATNDVTMISVSGVNPISRRRILPWTYVTPHEAMLAIELFWYAGQ